jgi:hypothetical protein
VSSNGRPARDARARAADVDLAVADRQQDVGVRRNAVPGVELGAALATGVAALGDERPAVLEAVADDLEPMLVAGLAAVLIRDVIELWGLAVGAERDRLIEDDAPASWT